MKIKVIPNSKKSFLKNNRLYLKSPPEKDKANKELIKFFKKRFNQKVEIISGKRSRDKVIKFFS